MGSAICSFLEKTKQDQLSLLKRLVEQRSYSYNKAGVDAVGEIIAESLAGIDVTCERVAEDRLGDQLVFRSSAARLQNRSGMLLIGHMDTVFPDDSSFTAFHDTGEKVTGPGVIDMKGGLVVAVYLLKALQACGLLSRIPITLLCNSDEEIGSPGSTALIHQLGTTALFGFVFESGGLQGEVVTGRKGKAGFRLEVTGRAGHAAFAGKDKASAIVALAHKIIGLENLNDPARGIVVNVGVVRGGTGPNSVPDRAEAEIDCRFLTMADVEYLNRELSSVAEENVIPGTSCRLVRTNSRLPMEQSTANRNLYRIVAKTAARLNMSCPEELRSGVSDANTVSELGVPVLDGFGPIGSCDHSDREYMVRDSLVARAKLATLALLDCWREMADTE